MDNNDDEPVVTTFKELKKKKLHLTENLKNVYNDGIKTIRSKTRRANDPRFDPRIYGVCRLDDWTFLEDEQQNVLEKLKKMLDKKQRPEDREKTLQALRLVKQRIATNKDNKFRRGFMNKMREEQIKTLESGKRVNFMKRSELRNCIQQERLGKMKKKQRERYLNRKSKQNPMIND